MSTQVDHHYPHAGDLRGVNSSGDPVEGVQIRIFLLSEFDAGAADFIETNHAALRPLFDDDAWEPFEKLVQGYAFADAQAQLDLAVRSSGTP